VRDDSAAAIGARLRARRVELRLSQRELAEPGISYAYISRLEHGARTPSLKALRKLAPKLAVTVHWLETGESDPARELAQLVLDLQPRRLPREAAELAQRVIAEP
jgi:transcriptional regulator with XRE-family HTH domain